MKKALIALLPLLLLPAVLGIDFEDPLDPETIETFDQILEPVMKVYNFVKYAATVVAVVFLVFAGVTFITSGNDQGKRNQAKMMGTYIIIGLIVIWVAPLVVQYLVG
ncbi:MAG: pilin [Nanoarchaeota archaeon]|nr:pilin [Nanoarchaeota archaeon]MBU1974999.1 pilin [Nanoarchaeota archaeon]